MSWGRGGAILRGTVAGLMVVCAVETARATDAADLAKKIQNPVADLMSVPLQFNYDSDIGVGADGNRRLLNVQPVIPFRLGAEWNLISRTILPLIDQRDVDPQGRGDASGVGDVLQSFFFSPRQPTDGGWIWGAGPVLLLRTASDHRLGAEKWGAGPTAVLLRQHRGWTYGALANHLWSVAGDDEREDINTTYFQPFVSFTTSSFTSFGVNAESTYDWEAEQWSVPINLTVTQVLKAGHQPLSLQAGVRYWLDSPDIGPDGWGFRFAVTLLFPR